MARIIRCAVISQIPQSSNKLYFSMGGRLVKSAKGVAFANRVTGELSSQWSGLSPMSASSAYGVGVCAYLNPVENAGYKTGKAATRWKRRDASNLYKLVADVVALVVGVDDSASFDTVASKRGTTGEEYMEIAIWEFDEGEQFRPPSWP